MAKGKKKAKAKAKRKAAKARVKTKRPFIAMSLEEAFEDAMDGVDAHCAPALMSKQQAVEFYGRIIDRCQSSVEALEEEIENATA
jgi:hypothetical protein